MSIPRLSRRTWTAVIASAAALIILVAGFALRHQWLPKLQTFFGVAQAKNDAGDSAKKSDGEKQGQSNSLHLSPQAIKNIGLKTAPLRLQPFERTMAVPAMVVERPGRSQIDIVAPFTAVVTRIYRIQGEAVKPGAPLFDLRLTHEDLVDAQREFLLAAEELDVIKKEVARLEKIGTGVIEGRRLLERKYEQQKTEAGLRARREGLLLHGLDTEQVNQILSSRKLLQGLTVTAPSFPEEIDHVEFEHVYHIQKLAVNPGQQVSVGTRLAVLADHCEVFIEGNAFEQDAKQLTKAANQNWDVTAVLTTEGEPETIRGLRIFYLADAVEQRSRAFHFFLKVANEVTRDVKDEAGHRFVSWKLKPGQRMELRIPVERLENQLVLPVDAVAHEGAESYVFEQNGDHFDRVPVHVKDRDKEWVVIENDGRLSGSTIAMNRAHQLLMALKNEATGGASAHGHPHPH